MIPRIESNCTIDAGQENHPVEFNLSKSRLNLMNKLRKAREDKDNVNL
jgi:hypothetical protein